MKKLFLAGNRYLKAADLTDFALLKLCLFSIGMLFGLLIPSKTKKSTGLLMAGLFFGTYLPLMSKFLCIAQDTD